MKKFLSLIILAMLFSRITAQPFSLKSTGLAKDDVTLDKKNKLLMTSCRGAATWWKDAYRFASGNKLVWLRSIN